MDIESFDEIIELFHTRTGIVYPVARRNDAVTGIRRVMAQMGFTDPLRFLEQISTDSDLFSRLVEHLAIAETYFFRDIAQFNEIRHRVVPELRALRGPDATLRAWSAGCSSGEEAYSLAILFEQEAVSGHVLATDISPKALAKAKQGTYGAWSLRGEGRQAAAHINANSSRLVIPDRLRARVDFRRLNLVSNEFPSLASGTTQLDLILCRNVLIYFDDRSIRDVAERLNACLARGGWLITGPSDPPLWDYLDLEPVTTAAGIFYRHTPHHLRSARRRPAETPLRQPERPVRAKESTRPTPAALSTAFSPARDKSGEVKRQPISSVAHIRDLADRGELSDAIAASEVAIAADPTAPEFHYLRAIALLAQDRKEEAFEALRRVIYLDRTLALAHFAMGTLLTRRGDFAKARRSFQRAYLLCATNDPDEALPLTDGERTEELAEAARAHIEMLNRNNSSSEGLRAT
jgi:chemotaxis protein methyltransferase CheR